MPNVLSISGVRTAAYWRVVRRTLQEVFKITSTKEANGLKRKLSGLTKHEQILFYHVEPLWVAAEIADKKPSDRELRKYLAIRNQEYPCLSMQISTREADRGNSRTRVALKRQTRSAR
jgi:hypothetical protein